MSVFKFGDSKCFSGYPATPMQKSIECALEIELNEFQNQNNINTKWSRGWHQDA